MDECNNVMLNEVMETPRISRELLKSKKTTEDSRELLMIFMKLQKSHLGLLRTWNFLLLLGSPWNSWEILGAIENSRRLKNFLGLFYIRTLTDSGFQQTPPEYPGTLWNSWELQGTPVNSYERQGTIETLKDSKTFWGLWKGLY